MLKRATWGEKKKTNTLRKHTKNKKAEDEAGHRGRQCVSYKAFAVIERRGYKLSTLLFFDLSTKREKKGRRELRN